MQLTHVRINKPTIARFNDTLMLIRSCVWICFILISEQLVVPYDYKAPIQY